MKNEPSTTTKKEEKENKWIWLNPVGADRQISASIRDIHVRSSDIINYNNDNNNEIGRRYRIDIPEISWAAYWEIANNLLTRNQKNNIDDDDDDNEWQYLTVNKNNNNVRKNTLKTLIVFALSICPACQTSNCAFYCKKNKKIKAANVKTSRKFIKCCECRRLFKTKYHLVDYTNYKNNLFSKCTNWSCQRCRDTFQDVYSEFLSFLKKSKKTLSATAMVATSSSSSSSSTENDIQRVFEKLSDATKRELKHDPRTLYYTIKLVINQKNRNKTKKKKKKNDIIIPPLAFIAETNKQASCYEKLIYNNKKFRMDVKTKYGSVVSRAKGGKNSFFRNYGLNKRHALSARVVIVPVKELEPEECILPKDLYRRLNCPKVIAAHRYPTLDVRSFTYHRVVSRWDYPCLGISTAIVTGNNADFDGDCLHIIPVTSLASRAELEYLGNPKYNMIVQNQLRVRFDHDEIQTLYSQFGINNRQIHAALFEYAKKTSSPEAYRVFCQLRKYCRWVWDYFSYIPTVSFGDFLEIYRKCKTAGEINYQEFINTIFPTIKPENGIKELISSQSSRFSIDHLWQIYGQINKDANMSFLTGMDKLAFIKMAIISRDAIIKDVAYYGYAHIKLTHCTKTIAIGYDGKLYTTDGILVGTDPRDFYGSRKK